MTCGKTTRTHIKLLQHSTNSTRQAQHTSTRRTAVGHNQSSLAPAEAETETHRGVTSSQLPSKHLFLIMSSRVIACSAVGGGATRVARSTSTVASSRLRWINDISSSNKTTTAGQQRVSQSEGKTVQTVVRWMAWQRGNGSRWMGLSYNTQGATYALGNTIL